MVLEPTGLLSIPLDAAERLIASSATFQTMTGAANETDALAFVHIAEASDEILPDGLPAHPRPRAIVWYGDNMVREKIGVGDFAGKGSMLIAFEAVRSSTYAVAEDDTPVEEKAKDDDALREFTNNLGAVVKEMENNSGGSDGTNGYLNNTGTSVLAAPQETLGNSEEEYFYLLLSMEFVG